MNAAVLYSKYLGKFFKLPVAVRAVSDSSNGTTGSVLKRLKIKNFKLFMINARPDGTFPAHGPDPWAKGALLDLEKTVRSQKADFGAIFDADGDRSFFVDDLGRPVPQEALVLLFQNEFPPPYLIDVRMGWLVRKSGLKIVESPVGHYFAKQIMKKKKLKLGVEFSGHTYFEHNLNGRKSYFDSGMRAMVHFANGVSRLKAQGKKLSEWLDSLQQYFRSGEINFKVGDKQAIVKKIEKLFSSSARQISRLDGLLMEFKDFWFSVRISNTEPLLRLNIEAKTKKILLHQKKQLLGIIRSRQ